MPPIRRKNTSLLVASSLFALRALVFSISHNLPLRADTPEPLKSIGLAVHKPEKCYNGYTLFANSPYVYLIDMRGHIVHVWSTNNVMAYKTVIGGNGNLMLSGWLGKSSLMELDIQSNVVWYHAKGFCHDFTIVTDDLLLLEYYENSFIGGAKTLNPAMELVNRNKDVLWSWKISDHLAQFKKLYGADISFSEDWAHNNACFILPENDLEKIDRRFKKGNILFSFSFANVIGIIDYPSGDIVWLWGNNILDGQHSPIMLKNGRIVLFDNGTKRGWSRVLEMDPLKGGITWQYRGKPKKAFYSIRGGNVQPLPNGNMLVCEATKGRYFEITRGKEIVWDYQSPFYSGFTKWYMLNTAHRYSEESIEPLIKQAKDHSGKSASLNDALEKYKLGLENGNDYEVVDDFIGAFDGKTLHMIAARKDNIIIKLLIRSPVTREEFTGFVSLQKERILNMYDAAEIPYPGAVTKKSKPPEDIRPVIKNIAFDGSEIELITVTASERQVIGVWDKSLIKQKATLSFIYNERNQASFDVAVFQPEDEYRLEKVHDILQGLIRQ